LFFGRPKVKKLVWGSKRIQGTGEKIFAAWPTNFCLSRGKF
jgi:hypothetical protein